MTAVEGVIEVAAEENRAPLANEVHAPTREVTSPVTDVIRRALDILLSVIILVLAAPLLVLVAAAIRIDSPGSALFRQPRVGRSGRLFTFYKFRGMYVDAHERWPELYDYNYSASQLHDLRFHPARDPRVTRVGRFIRRTSIDELLNLWNVLKSDMNIVGPRPEIPEMMPHYGDAVPTFLSVKPGITSLAKVTGRDELTFTETLALDLEYIRNRSIALDLKIMCATAATVLLQRGVLGG
jgi:lipopolysaccharide/colanic/teichoic acid biosynthesis glycosyltransferase